MNGTIAKIVSLLSLAFIVSCKHENKFPNAKTGKSLLWEITGNGLKSPSYFLGTMHLMCAEDAVLSETVKKIIDRTSVIYLEVDMDNAGELLSGVLSLTDKSNKTLSGVLTEDEYGRVRKFFETFQPDIPFSALEHQYPIMLSSSLYELLLPCEKKNGVELQIINEAYQKKKETKGLETLAFQASIFDSIPYEDQAKELVKTIDSLDKYKRSMDEMMKVYKSQDIEQLYKLSTEEESGVSAYTDLLLFNRNKNWVTQFPAIAQKGSTLFAVGAGHLGGEKGVINLLKRKGYIVRPIEN